MNTIHYVLSSSFSYESYICDDVGEVFGKEYGWRSTSIRDDSLANSICVIDPWIKNGELHDCVKRLKARGNAVWIRLVDTNWPHAGDTNSEVIIRLAQEFDLNWVFTYTINEFSGYLISLSRSHNFVIAPYLYDEKKELPIDHTSRKNKILLSGATHEFYHLRSSFRFYRRLWPPLRIITDELRHPGYLSAKDPSSITRDAYINHLSAYKYAFVCSGRTRSEFLKYRELAYAGVAPVGDLPNSLSDCPDGAFVKYVGGARSVSRISFESDHTTTIARNYRLYLKSKRLMTVTGEAVNRQIVALSHRR